MFYIKIYRQKNYEGNDNGNSYLNKQVYFEADDLDHLSSKETDFQINIDYRKLIINHLINLLLFLLLSADWFHI